MTEEKSISTPPRREFLGRLARLAAVFMGTGALGFAFWDHDGPRPPGSRSITPVLPDYRLPEQTGKLALSRGEDRKQTITRAVEALGGMAAFIAPGDRVLIKVNAAFAAPPMLGATTHPDAVARVIDLCRRAGAADVGVTDNPINDPAACFALSGIDAAVRAAGGRVILPRPELFEPYSVPNGRLIQRWPVLTGPLRQADKVIGMAPVKDHHRSGASMTLKNWYGLLGGRRNIFHQHIHAAIAELAMLVQPSLVILDGTVSMTANGPTGGSLDDLKPTHTVIAGTDPVAVDAYGAGLLGREIHDLPYLELARKAGAGSVNWRDLKFIDVQG